MPIIIDETLTAFWCGAPSLYQRDEYLSWFQPDLIVFGKALKVNGIGVNFEGSFMRTIPLQSCEKRLETVIEWFDLPTRAVPIPSLIEALYTLETAKAENWISRGVEIGETMRSVIKQQEQERNVRIQKGPQVIGIGALTFVERERVEGLLIQGTPIGRFVRLLPVLDEVMSSEKSLRALIIGKGSREARQQVSRTMVIENKKPLWCYICGERTKCVVEKGEWCKICCLSSCGERACLKAFPNHQCIGKVAGT